MEKVTVRELIEMLANCDWNSEVTCIDQYANEDVESVRKRCSHGIRAVSQSTTTGTQIVFEG